MSAPTIGPTNMRGHVLPDTSAGSVEALELIYSNQDPNVKNPLVFYVYGAVGFPGATEVVFDVIADAEKLGHLFNSR